MLPRPCASSRPTTRSPHSRQFPWLVSLAFPVCPRKLPAKTAQEFFSYVRANPGKVNYATGNGTSILATAQLALIEKLDMQHIPYRGDAPATADLIAGRVQMMIGTPGSAHAPGAGRKIARAGNPTIASQSAGAGYADAAEVGLTGLRSRHGRAYSARRSFQKKLLIASPQR